MSASRLLGGPEVCDRLGCSHQKLRGLAFAGQIAFVQVGCRRKYKPEDVEAFIANNRRHGVQQEATPKPQTQAKARPVRARQASSREEDLKAPGVIREILRGL